MTTTPLPEPDYGQGRYLSNAGTRDAYTEAQLRRYGEAEYKRAADKEMALTTALTRMTEALNQATKEHADLIGFVARCRDSVPAGYAADFESGALACPEDVASYVAAAFSEMVAERDALKADAERYRWLRDKSRSVDWSRYVNVESTPPCTAYSTTCRATGDQMNEAIDRAMKGTS